MRQIDGERRVKALQRDFLAWVEDHPALQKLDPETYNDIRHKAFRSTFFAFRLGVVGLDNPPEGLYKHFFGWLGTHPEVKDLSPELLLAIAERCFVTSLRAFWIGVRVSAAKKEPSDEL